MSSSIIYLFTIFIILSGCFKTKSKKEYGMHSISQSEFTYRGQIERSIELKFNVEKNEISEITTLAEIPKNYSGELSYKWSLGTNVKIEKGDLEGKILKLPENKKIKLQIFVKGFNADTARHIRFEIIGLNSARRIFADGIISSNQNNSFESIVKEVEAYKKENQK